MHPRATRFACAALIFLAAALTACGGTTSIVVATPTLPKGATYSNIAYRFSLTYPDGWSCALLLNSASGDPGSGVPCPSANDNAPPTTTPGTLYPVSVNLAPTKAGTAQSSLSSRVTLVVLDLRNPVGVSKATLSALTAGMAGRAKDTSLHAMQIGGHTAYASTPIQQSLLNNVGTSTHTDYYIEGAKVEYHLSTDVVSGDGVDAQVSQIVSGFTLS